MALGELGRPGLLQGQKLAEDTSKVPRDGPHGHLSAEPAGSHLRTKASAPQAGHIRMGRSPGRLQCQLSLSEAPSCEGGRNSRHRDQLWTLLNISLILLNRLF